MTADIELDHVALAVERQHEAWPRYAGDLGGTWVAGGFSVGFRTAQVRFRRGMKIEVIAPHRTDRNDFLRRFLDRHGPGPHHLTYKVADIEAALAAASAAGYPPVNVDLADPHWKEAFLHPKAAHGIVIQLAQAEGEWSTPPPAAFPVARPPRPADLLHVAHAVASLPDALTLFEGVLRGERAGEGEGWIDLTWEGSGTVRLLDAAGSPDLAAWLAGAPGRLHHVAFATTEPGTVAGAAPAAGGTFEVAPDDNLGTRLLLRED